MYLYVVVTYVALSSDKSDKMYGRNGIHCVQQQKNKLTLPALVGMIYSNVIVLKNNINVPSYRTDEFYSLSFITNHICIMGGK